MNFKEKLLFLENKSFEIPENWSGSIITNNLDIFATTSNDVRYSIYDLVKSDKDVLKNTAFLEIKFNTNIEVNRLYERVLRYKLSPVIRSVKIGEALNEIFHIVEKKQLFFDNTKLKMKHFREVNGLIYSQLRYNNKKRKYLDSIYAKFFKILYNIAFILLYITYPIFFIAYQVLKGNICLKQNYEDHQGLLILASGPEIDYLNKIKSKLFPNENELVIFFESKHSYSGDLNPSVRKKKLISIVNILTILFQRNFSVFDILDILNNQIKLKNRPLQFKILLEILKDDCYITFFKKLFRIINPEKILTSSLSLANISARNLKVQNYQAVDGLGISEVPAFPYTGEIILCPSDNTIKELSEQYKGLTYQIIGKEVYL